MSPSTPPNQTTTTTTTHRSALKDFLASIATIRGDLSNITAPPFVLATYSTTELPQHWASNTSLFLAPAAEPDPATRALKVLTWFLGSLKAQQYAGRTRRGEEEGVGIKKPLNAFLGEVFLGEWSGDQDGVGRTRLVAEQVSHHPPVTATILWNDEQGIRAEGYTCQEITFTGTVNIKQIGHAILHLDKYDEDYLIPLPQVKVKGILSGAPYPELIGTYHITSTNGYTAEIDFSGKGFFSGGVKNSVDAKLYRDDEPEKPLYTVCGQWSGRMTIRDEAATTTGIEEKIFDTGTQDSTPITVAAMEDQDPWESRRAWHGVIAALNRGDMQATSDEKGKVEQAQRQMRKDETRLGTRWKQAFFHTVDRDEVFEALANKIGMALEVQRTVGIWKFDHSTLHQERPFHAGLTPAGRLGEERRSSTSSSSITGIRDGARSNSNGVRVSRPENQSDNVQSKEVEQQEYVDVVGHDDAASKMSQVPDSTFPPAENRAIEEMLRDKYSSARKR